MHQRTFIPKQIIEISKFKPHHTNSLNLHISIKE
jgi:hypothetical protein